MTAPATDPHDPRRASRATGLLATFQDAGVLAAADVHVARRLGRLGGETDDEVLLAAALTVRSTRLGSVVLDLATAAATTTADAAAADSEPPAEGHAGPQTESHAGPTLVVGLPWPDPSVWAAAVARSPLVAATEGPAHGRPLRLHAGLLSLDRYWRQEEQVAAELLSRSAGAPPVDLERLAAALARLFPGEHSDDQRLAAAVCALRRVAVVAGGPGTGKTTTVALLLAALADQPGPPARIALAAPTGKAAARLEEAVRAATAGLPEADRARLGDLRASTVHRLLGSRPDARSRFRHDRTRRLPHDVVVVDETSMVSLTLMARLLEAVRADARVVLVGDPDQLASVEAGAVLGDLVDPAAAGGRTPALLARLRAVAPHDVPADAPVLPDTAGGRVADGVALLRTVHRFDPDSAIARLARAVRAGDGPAAVAVLEDARAAGGTDGVGWLEVADDADLPSPALAELRADVVAAGSAVRAAALVGDAAAALAALEQHRLLCAHRRGPRGVARWSDRSARWLREDATATGDDRPDGLRAGSPLLVTANDHEAGLYNGDTGVVVVADDGLVAAFARGGAPFLVPLVRLADVVPLHALTVHRAQGSQADRVTVLLPPEASPLATRETLYTAVTRARRHVRLVGSAGAVLAATARPVARATGLRRRLDTRPEPTTPAP